MKFFSRVVLPVALFIAAVFGITFVRMYSPEDPDTAPRTKGAPGTSGAREPLRIPLRTAAPVSPPVDKGREFLTYWNPEIEVGVAGHFEFWAHNTQPDPVTVRVFEMNCQCAGLEVAAVPQPVLQEYAVGSALAASPFCPAPALGAAIAHVTFERQLQWSKLLDQHKGHGEKYDVVLPGAGPAAGTQAVIFRLGWNPKEEAGPKEVNATISAGIGDAQPSHYKLTVHTLIVPSFDLVRRDGPTAWGPVSEKTLQLGELRENSEARRTVYMASTTRTQFVYRVATDRPDPCVIWTEPAPASAEEVQALSDFFNQPGRPNRRIRSVYKFEVTVRERCETDAGGKKELHQLDLGLLDRQLMLTAVGGGSERLSIRGRVLGDISFLPGAPDGRVDLGSAFPADEDRTKELVLVAERPGIDLALAAAETFPNYLKVRLDPLEKIEGRSQWRLRVTVPKGQLYGSLPQNSGVVLTTGGPNPRRLRIPVRGMSYSSGGAPRI